MRDKQSDLFFNSQTSYQHFSPIPMLNIQEGGVIVPTYPKLGQPWVEESKYLEWVNKQLVVQPMPTKHVKSVFLSRLLCLWAHQSSPISPPPLTKSPTRVVFLLHLENHWNDRIIRILHCNWNHGLKCLQWGFNVAAMRLQWGCNESGMRFWVSAMHRIRQSVNRKNR